MFSTVLVSLSGLATAAPAPGWTAPVQIEHLSTAGNYPNGIHIAAAPNGRVLAAWTQYLDSTGYNAVLWSFYVPGTGWTNPVALTDCYDLDNPAVGAFANGSFLLVYRSSCWTGNGLYAQIWYPDTGWAAGRVLISTDAAATDVASPAVGTDAAGDAFVAYRSYNGSVWDVRAQRYTPAGGWLLVNATLETGTATAYAPWLAVDHAGDAVAVWLQFDGVAQSVFANRYVVGSGWGTATLLEAGTNNAYGTHVAADAAGNAMALWYQNNGTRDVVYGNRFVVGTGWGSATQVSIPGEGSAYYPAVEATSGGEFLVAFAQTTNGTQHLFTSMWPTTGAGSTPVNMTPDGTTNVYNVISAADSGGNVLLTWTRYLNGTTGIYSAWWQPAAGWTDVGARLDNSAIGLDGPGAQTAAGGGGVATWIECNGVTCDYFEAMYMTPDTTAPALSVSGPAAGATTTVPTVTVTGMTEPGASVVVNGLVADVGDAGEFSLQLALVPGVNNISVEAKDAAGNEVYAYLTVTFNDPAPGLASQLATANANLATTQSSLASTQADLAAARLQLTATNASLTATQASQAQKNTDVSSQITAANGAAGTAMIVGILGVVIGLAGIAMGFMMSRKRDAVAVQTKPAEPPKP